MEEGYYINKAQDILSKIEKKCKDVLYMESNVALVDYGGFKLSSKDIVEYENMTSQFLENLMHVDVNEVVNHGFLCNYSECGTTFFLGKKRVLTLMIHILQDITLFRNTLQLPDYIRLFSSIARRRMAINFIEKLKGEIRIKKKRIDRLKGLLTQLESQYGNNCSPDHTETKNLYKKELGLKESRRESQEKDLEDWEKEKSISGESSIKIDSIIKKTSDDDMVNIIMTYAESKSSSKDVIQILLRKVIYLRSLDNLCNTLLQRSKGFNEENIQKSIDDHQGWINVLERVSDEVDNLQ